jgi:hypothetical protein
MLLLFFSSMARVVNPDSLFNMSLEVLGQYVSDFMKRMIETPSEPRGDDGKYHHYQEPCSRLEDMLQRVPPNRGRDITHFFISHVNQTYIELMSKERFMDACEEIAPLILKSDK